MAMNEEPRIDAPQPAAAAPVPATPGATKVMRDPKTGNYWRFDGTMGQWRPLRAEEYGSIRPTSVLQEMGVKGGERFVVKNLARNPSLAAAWLRARGYEVLPYGSGFNFAVRRPGETSWKVLDPEFGAGGPGEFLHDIADLTSDIFSGVTTGLTTAAGAAAGPAGAALGSAGGAYLTELARQAAGSAAGIEGNFAPGGSEALLQGAVGAAAPAIGEVVGKGVAAGARVAGRAAARTLRGAKTIGREALSAILGIPERADLDIVQTVLERARLRNPNGSFVNLHPPEDALNVMRLVNQGMREGANSHLGRLTALRDGMLAAADAAGSGVDLLQGDLVGKLQNVAGTVGGLRKPNLVNDPEIATLNHYISAILNPPTRETVHAAAAQAAGVPLDEFLKRASPAQLNDLYQRGIDAWRKSLQNVRPSVAKDVLDQIDEWTRGMNSAFSRAAEDPNAPPLTVRREVINQVKNIGADLRSRIADALGGPDSRYSLIQSELHEKLGLQSALRDRLGSFDPAKVRPSAESFVRDFARGGRSDYRALIGAYDGAFSRFAGHRINGPEFGKLLHNTALGLQFTPEGVQAIGKFGVPRFRPRFGATGVPIGTALAGSVGGSFVGLTGAGLGASVGGALGLAAASPRFVVRYGPAIVNATHAAERLASNLAASQADIRLSQALTSGALTLATRESTAMTGKFVARPDKPGRRRIDLTQ